MGLLPEKGTVLDIVANTGITRASIALKFSTAHVFVFKPISNNIEAPEKVVRHYKLTNVTALKMALGKQAGELKMILPVKINSAGSVTQYSTDRG